MREIAHLLHDSFPEINYVRIMLFLVFGRVLDRLKWSIRRQSLQPLLFGAYIGRYFVAIHSGHVVGFVSVGFKGQYLSKTWGVSLLCVNPRYRCKGVGSRLMETAMVSAKKEGAVFIGLSVAKTNEVAYRMYQKMGFIQHLLYDDSLLYMLLKL